MLADIWWRNHLQRELSIIVALFYGQFKSTCACHTCGYCSARYEPFSRLQLDMPEDLQATYNVCFVPLGGGAPVKCSVRIDRGGTVGDVLVETAR